MIAIENMAGTGKPLECRKIVIKLGSNVVLARDGGVDVPILSELADTIAGLRARKVEVIIVTSGAIGLACGQLKRARPKVIPEKQALAAIGQINLMHIYQGILADRGLLAAQVLLTRADMEDRQRYLNARHALERLFELGAIPIINENDTISTDELSFGDNDMLSAYVAVKTKADLLVLLSTVGGVMRVPPGKGRGDETNEIIPVIPRIDNRIEQWVDDSRSENGMGGMQSKLQAAKLASEAGVHTVIAGGKLRGILDRILSGDFPGTYIPASRERAMSAIERWIGFGRASRGHRLTLDDGAVNALLNKKTSLLPVGVIEVSGQFKHGDVIDICDREGTTIARGLVNYSSEEIEKIKGRKTSQIESILGTRKYDEVIHRDNLVVLKNEA